MQNIFAKLFYDSQTWKRNNNTMLYVPHRSTTHHTLARGSADFPFFLNALLEGVRTGGVGVGQ
jgi:capsid portal protein